MTYASAGVDTDAAAAGLAKLLSWVGQTKEFREGIGEALVPNGFFASVLRMTDRLALAISTDGVGSKSAVAQMVGFYEGIG
ncbi:phosphoribosylformylglycinamidine cyclo-ligase, partial [Candidatus Sumerlaeota bacterium]|nr:phosphoribosylformylglycinamidine cyclo-ligase [Candidatus Sumerlaeota bacterium]